MSPIPLPTDTDAASEPHDRVLFTLRRWQILLLLVGFPFAYWINSLMPWSYGLFVERDHRFFIPFGLSLCAIHWASFATAMFFVKKAGGRPSDVGLHMQPRSVATFIALVAGVGCLFVGLRYLWPFNNQLPEDWRFFYPFTLSERLFFIFLALSAGFCEEAVYRGVAITALQQQGWRTWQAVILATLAFVFVHGIAAIFLFPFLLVAGLIYAGIFLWRRSLTPGIYVHVFFDLMALAAI